MNVAHRFFIFRLLEVTYNYYLSETNYRIHPNMATKRDNLSLHIMSASKLNKTKQ